jgi:hypothetical protein
MTPPYRNPEKEDVPFFGSFFVLLKQFFVSQSAAKANSASFSCFYPDSRAIIAHEDPPRNRR